MRIRIQLFTLIRIRILVIIKVMGICDNWAIDPPGLHCAPMSLHCEFLNFDLIADPDTALHSNADTDPDPDTASKNNADPDSQPSICRPKDPRLGPGSGLGIDPDQFQADKNVT